MNENVHIWAAVFKGFIVINWFTDIYIFWHAGWIIVGKVKNNNKVKLSALRAETQNIKQQWNY